MLIFFPISLIKFLLFWLEFKLPFSSWHPIYSDIQFYIFNLDARMKVMCTSIYTCENKDKSLHHLNLFFSRYWFKLSFMANWKHKTWVQKAHLRTIIISFIIMANTGFTLFFAVLNTVFKIRNRHAPVAFLLPSLCSMCISTEEMGWFLNDTCFS